MTPAAPPAATPQQSEDILAKYGRLGRERAGRCRGRYVAAGFAGITRPGDVRQQHQTAAMLAHQASLAAMAGGALIVEAGGAATDTRWNDFAERQSAEGVFERVRQQFQQQPGSSRNGRGLL